MGDGECAWVCVRACEECKPAVLTAARCFGCCPFVTHIVCLCVCVCVCVCVCLFLFLSVCFYRKAPSLMTF